jgi:hypothetical protein
MLESGGNRLFHANRSIDHLGGSGLSCFVTPYKIIILQQIVGKNHKMLQALQKSFTTLQESNAT